MGLSLIFTHRSLQRGRFGLPLEGLVCRSVVRPANRLRRIEFDIELRKSWQQASVKLRSPMYTIGFDLDAHAQAEM